MHCVTCKNSTLEPKELEPGLIAASCLSCEGTLISLMNYRYWLDKFPTTASDRSVELNDTAPPFTSVRACPKCSRLMTRYQVGATTDHQLDLCASCDEAWLDKGEWQLLNRLDLQGKLPKIFTDAWQRNIRKAKQEAALHERYEKLIGSEDFAKASEFKRWVYQHPQRETIKQFLQIAPE